jgi:hypothetical protein
MRSKTMCMVLLCYRILVAFVGDDPELACIWTTCDVGLKTMLLPLHWTWVVITYVNSEVCWTIYELVITCDLYVESCTILVERWLVRDPSWYSSDYRVYMGSSMTVWPLRWPPLYLCSYKLDDSIIYIYIYNLISTIYIIPSESTDETTGVSSKPVHYLTECCYLFQDQDMPYACICMNKRNVGPMSFVCAHTSIGLQIFVPQISPAVETHAFTCTYLYSTVYIWN